MVLRIGHCIFMTNWNGFWSYVHADDDAEGGRISTLARDIVAQFEMVSGESISLFLDRDAIEWGDNWRDGIDGGLQSVAFFVPVLTPRYFMSAECRRELQFFARRAKSLGMKELVLPLSYVDVRQLREDAPTDDLVELVRTFQWEDWRELRFVDRSSAEYRKGVAKLAMRLIDASRRTPDISAEVSKGGASPSLSAVADESPGFLDLTANSEESLPKLSAALGLMTSEIEKIGEIMTAGAVEIKSAGSGGSGFALRLFVARRIAARLIAPVESIEASANEYVSRLHDVDQGFRAIIEQAPSSVSEDESSRESVCSFFRSVREMGDIAHESFESVQGMIDGISGIEKMSKDLRPILRQLRQALTRMLEAREVVGEWVRMIEVSPVEYEAGIEARGRRS